MKQQSIGLLAFSHYSMSNYGGILQACALKKSLLDFSENVNNRIENICYNPKSYHPTRKHLILSSIYNKLIKPLINDKKRQIRTKDFYDKYMFFGSKALNDDEILDHINNNFSKVIIGSDQVLNPQINNYSGLYLGEGISAKVYYYAASFGSSLIDDSWKNSILKNRNNFSSISVREKTGKEIFKSLGFKNVRVDIDPTLLVKKEEWVKLASKCLVKYPKKYVFCYIMPGNKIVVNKIKRAAKKIARQRNASIVYCGQKDYKRILENHNLSGVGPIEWIYGIANAEAVVTNSFHGVAFSVNLNKPFVAFTNKNHASERSDFSSRIYDFTSALSLEKNVDPQEESFGFIFEETFVLQNRILETMRQESLSYLRGILDD